MKEVAAFVAPGVDDLYTGYHDGGTPIDAVAVDGWEQAGPERFEALGLVVGQFDLADVDASPWHRVRGDAIEVVSDGSDRGAAVVEVHGTDDRFWRVELTRVRSAYASGGRRELGPLCGLDIAVRRSLEPGSRARGIEVWLDGEPVTDGFRVGARVFPSDELDGHARTNGDLSWGGFDLDLGVLWLAMGGTEGAQAVAMPGANLARTWAAGGRALLHRNHVVAPLQVVGAAEPAVTPFLLAVGPTVAASASATLGPVLPEPLGPGAGAGREVLVSTDPEAVGLPAGTEVWSWDFDAFEVMHGWRSPL